MVRVTIICLIYKSTKLLEAVYSSLLKNTPMLRNGQAELIFIANDATNSVIQKLEDLKLNYYINNNKTRTEEELFKEGYGVPEYISRVYYGYNQGILHAKSDVVVLINSDHLFSSDWLENLLKYLDFNTVVSSKLVERKHPKFGVFPAAIEKNFGESIDNFNEIEFEKFSLKVRKTGVQTGGGIYACLYV